MKSYENDSEMISHGRKIMKCKWTQCEIDYLKHNYGIISPNQCARALNRSTYSTKKKACRLGLGRERLAFTESEIKYVKMQYEKQGPRQIAKALNRKVASVYQLANRRLGLHVNHEFRRNRTINTHSGRKRSQLTKMKLSGHAKKRVGILNPNWKGGITPMRSAMRKKLWPVWIYPILLRDNFTCQHCGSTECLVAHHLRPYKTIREMVMKQNPALLIDNYVDKEKLMKLMVLEHKVEDGITLCYDCHEACHFAKRDELTGKPYRKDGGNQQPSLSKVVSLLDRKVQRLTLEDTTTNKSDTSVPTDNKIPVVSKI